MPRKSKAAGERKRAKASVKAPKGAKAAKIRRTGGGRMKQPSASDQLAAYQLAHMKARDAQNKEPGPSTEERYIASVKKPMFNANIVRKAGSEARNHFKDLYSEYPDRRNVIEREENSNIYGRVYDAMQRQNNDYEFNKHMAKYAAARDEGRDNDARDYQDEAVHKYIRNMRDEEATRRGYNRGKEEIAQDLHLHKQERTDVPMENAPSPATPSPRSPMPSVHSTPPASPAPVDTASSPMSGPSGGSSPVQVNISISGGGGNGGVSTPSVHVNQPAPSAAGSNHGTSPMQTSPAPSPTNSGDVPMQSPVSQAPTISTNPAVWQPRITNPAPVADDSPSSSSASTPSGSRMSSPQTLSSGFYHEDHPDDHEMQE